MPRSLMSLPQNAFCSFMNRPKSSGDLLVIGWALIAMAVAQFPPIFHSPWIAAIYYVVAGLGWVLPAMPLIRWMQRPDRDTEDA